MNQSQDLAVNGNPALIVVHGIGITGMDVTHLGMFDIPLVANIPNIVYLAPTNKEEYLAMLEWGLEQDQHPVVVRVPSKGIVTTGNKIEADFSQLNKYKETIEGSEVAIIGLGAFYQLGEKVHTKLQETM
jgi:1-deoxy-D-xylulose-5-phosphate synthase